MSEQPKSIPGAGTTERQEDWTIESLCVEFVENDFKLSRRKSAWLIQTVERFMEACWASVEDDGKPLDVDGVEWAPDEWVVQKLQMPSFLRPDETSINGFWCECAAYICDLLDQRKSPLEYGPGSRRREMVDACDQACLL